MLVLLRNFQDLGTKPDKHSVQACFQDLFIFWPTGKKPRTKSPPFQELAYGPCVRKQETDSRPTRPLDQECRLLLILSSFAFFQEARHPPAAPRVGSRLDR
ncbi:unnamed protein product [Nesidiocoris tenuis]|uniref:Uncharacterized protein n=1 Tax=Nesidiocoris tenuis TaxID=355587 RepID=A0A6H5G3H1_9HEMI|nr:unnamed protein product [Nesidiocoris tenuis]